MLLQGICNSGNQLIEIVYREIYKVRNYSLSHRPTNTNGNIKFSKPSAGTEHIIINVIINGSFVAKLFLRRLFVRKESKSNTPKANIIKPPPKRN